LGLGSETAADEPDPDAARQAAEDQLIAALDEAVRSKFASDGSLGGRLAGALRRVASFAKSANNSCLRAVAELGQQASEAAINLGWLFNDSREVAQSAVSISSAVEELASSIGDLSASSDISASQAESARETMRCCIGDSRGASEAMSTIQACSSNIEARLRVLQTAVDQIGSMTGSIEAIARQTNLLALNATIEAARAGEQGRGFAVVAAEVKSLSVQTAKATKDIQDRVNTLKEEMKGISSAVQDSLKSVGAGGAVVRQVATIIEGVGDEVSEVASRIRGLSDLLQQQRAATSEIAKNTQHISEKASKTKDEVAAIGRRLQGSEVVVEKTFKRALMWPVDHLGLVRFAADAAAWKRWLSSVLLATTPAPGAMPRFPAEEALAEASVLCAADGTSGEAIVGDLKAAIDDAERNSRIVVSEVKNSNWGAATPAYIRCEEALVKAIAAVERICSPSETSAAS
jgi:methyl-accepting chemotaxis protein